MLAGSYDTTTTTTTTSSSSSSSTRGVRCFRKHNDNNNDHARGYGSDGDGVANTHVGGISSPFLQLYPLLHGWADSWFQEVEEEEEAETLDTTTI